MNNLNIDSNAVMQQRDNLIKVKNNLDEIVKCIESDTNVLKDYWNSKTSKDVFESFEEFCEYFKTVETYFEKDIKFLENNAIGTYEMADGDISKQVDNHITTM